MGEMTPDSQTQRAMLSDMTDDSGASTFGGGFGSPTFRARTLARARSRSPSMSKKRLLMLTVESLAPDGAAMEMAISSLISRTTRSTHR